MAHLLYSLLVLYSFVIVSDEFEFKFDDYVLRFTACKISGGKLSGNHIKNTLKLLENGRVLRNEREGRKRKIKRYLHLQGEGREYPKINLSLIYDQSRDSPSQTQNHDLIPTFVLWRSWYFSRDL
jgi:hypothetical protein